MILDHVAGVPPRDANPPLAPQIIHVDDRELDLCIECDHMRMEHGPNGCRVHGEFECYCPVPHDEVEEGHHRAGAATCPRCDERTD